MNLLCYFGNIADPRRSQGQRYQLKFVLLFVIFAILANSKSYRNIEDFIETHLKRLNKTFKLKWKRAPDYTQIRNILKAVNKDSLEEVFRMYSKELSEPNKNKTKLFIAFDGKTLRGSIDNFKDKRALQELFAFETDGKIIMAHLDIDEKSNEIPAVQELIKILNLSNCVFTMDAFHCQKKL